MIALITVRAEAADDTVVHRCAPALRSARGIESKLIFCYYPSTGPAYLIHNVSPTYSAYCTVICRYLSSGITSHSN